MSLCLVMMLWIVRARLSVPPPGPAVAMNSSGFVGFHSAAAIWGARSVAAPASAARVNFTDMFRSRDFSVLNRANSSPVARRRGRGTAEGGGRGQAHARCLGSPPPPCFAWSPSPAARVRSQMLRASSTSTSRHLLPVEFGPVGDHGALLLERRDLVGAEAVLGQDLG